MKCNDVRRFLSAYLDSELDATTHFQIQTHLAECEACGARIEQEKRLEESLVKSVRSVSTKDDSAIWDRALAGVRQAAPQGAAERRLGTRRAVLAVAASLVLTAGAYFAYGLWTNERRELDIAETAAENHVAYIKNRLQAKVDIDSHVQLVSYFRDRFDCSLAKESMDEDVRLVGARNCRMGGVASAYIMYEFRHTPISMFVIHRESLPAFPGAVAALSTGATYVHCSVEGYNFSMTHDKDRVLCTVGAVDTAVLDRLLACYVALP